MCVNALRKFAESFINVLRTLYEILANGPISYRSLKSARKTFPTIPHIIGLCM
jgi:hypothetical protein